MIGINFPSKSGDLSGISILKQISLLKYCLRTKRQKELRLYSYFMYFDRGEGFVRINRTEVYLRLRLIIRVAKQFVRGERKTNKKTKFRWVKKRVNCQRNSINSQT